MTSLRQMIPLLAGLTLFTAVALGLAADAVGQERGRREAPQQRARTGEQNREPEQRAEQERQRQREGRPQGRGLDSRERRVQFLEIALKAYDEAGWERNAQALARAVRYGRLELQGAGPEDLAAAAEGVPSIGNLIELLQGAFKLLDEKGQRERAMACNDLAEYYAARERARRAEAEPPRERPRPGNLADRAQRLEILRLARIAHAEAGDRHGAAQMERILHLAELQHEGANAEAIAEASQGLSQELIIDLVRRAADLYAEWNAHDRADMCRRLVQFYRDREAGAGSGDDPDRARVDREREREHVIRELQERVERLQQELREIQELLRHLMR